VIFNPDPVIKSVFNISKLSKLVKETNGSDYFVQLQAESRVLLQESFKLWATLYSYPDAPTEFVKLLDEVFPWLRERSESV